MQTVRAKFRCNHVQDNAQATAMAGTGVTVFMTPVFSDDPSSDNKKFTDATPAGNFNMTITVPETAAFFVVGQEYYLDIAKA
ncbi:hypothetical protein [Solidesulfovibrio sp.]